MPTQGEIYHYNPKEDVDDNCFYQVGDLYRLMDKGQKQVLISNTAADIAPVTKNIKYRHATHCYLADKNYGERITEALGLELQKVVGFSSLSHKELAQATKQEMDSSTSCQDAYVDLILNQQQIIFIVMRQY